MKKCEELLNRLLDVASTETGPDEELREHLDECRECRELFEDTRALHGTVGSVPDEEPSEWVTERILAEARAKAPHSVDRRSTWRIVFGGVSAAILVVVIVLQYRYWSETESPSDPSNDVVALETSLDEGLSKVRDGIDETGVFHRDTEPAGVSERLESFRTRFDSFRLSTEAGSFPLDSVAPSDSPEKEDLRKSRSDPIEKRSHIS